MIRFIKYHAPLFLGIIVGLILAACLTSCLTPKRLNRICQLCPVKTEIKDSIVVKEVDRPVPYAVPGPKIHVSVPNPCADLCDSLGRLKNGFKREIKTHAGTATLFTQDNNLHVKCDSDSLKGIINAKDKIIESYSKTKEQVRGCELEHRNGFDYFCRYATGIFTLIGIYMIARKKYPFLP